MAWFLPSGPEVHKPSKEFTSLSRLWTVWKSSVEDGDKVEDRESCPKWVSHSEHTKECNCCLVDLLISGLISFLNLQ